MSLMSAPRRWSTFPQLVFTKAPHKADSWDMFLRVWRPSSWPWTLFALRREASSCCITSFHHNKKKTRRQRKQLGSKKWKTIQQIVRMSLGLCDSCEKVWLCSSKWSKHGTPELRGGSVSRTSEPAQQLRPGLMWRLNLLFFVNLIKILWQKIRLQRERVCEEIFYLPIHLLLDNRSDICSSLFTLTL